MKLWQKIFIGLFLGFVVGMFLGPHAQYLKPIGTVFLNLINMMISLLVFSTMVMGITSINDPQKLGRVGIKAMALYLFTTVIAISIAIGCAFLIAPGAGMDLSPDIASQASQPSKSLTDILLSIIPRNPIMALAEGNVLQIMSFSIFLGIAINLVGEKAQPLLKVIESLSFVMYRLIAMVMNFSPIGVFAIMAGVAGAFGLAILLPLGKFLMAFYIACFIHLFIVLCGMLRLMAQLRPMPFFRGMGDAIMMAFSTCSSSATLPVSMRCVEENLGISKNMSSFVMPLGCAISMNGSAIFQSMAAVFISQAYGMPLNAQQIMTLIFAATMSSFGTAGVSGGGFVMLSVVVSSVGLPIEGIAILIGIDRLREMGATTLNVLGDAICAVLLAKQEGELNETVYNKTLPEKAF